MINKDGTPLTLEQSSLTANNVANSTSSYIRMNLSISIVISDRYDIRYLHKEDRWNL